MASETDLLWLFIQAVPQHLPHVRVFRRNVIRGAMLPNGGRISNGIPGQADAYAIAKGGKHVEIETKSFRGVEAENQKRWRTWCESFGVPHLQPRPLKNETPEETVDRWILELKTAI